MSALANPFGQYFINSLQPSVDEVLLKYLTFLALGPVSI